MIIRTLRAVLIILELSSIYPAKMKFLISILLLNTLLISFQSVMAPPPMIPPAEMRELAIAAAQAGKTLEQVFFEKYGPMLQAIIVRRGINQGSAQVKRLFRRNQAQKQARQAHTQSAATSNSIENNYNNEFQSPTLIPAAA